MLLRGGKKSSQFLSSCNEDNLIKIKAKLIKDLKVQVFGCIISLKHGRMGLLSSREVPGHADRWCSHQAIRMTNIQLNYIFLTTLIGLSAPNRPALLLLKKLVFWQAIPPLSWEFCLGTQLETNQLSTYIFMVFMVLSLILLFPNWKAKHVYTHIPLFNVRLFLPFYFLEKPEKIENSKGVCFTWTTVKNIFNFLMSARIH